MEEKVEHVAVGRMVKKLGRATTGPRACVSLNEAIRFSAELAPLVRASGRGARSAMTKAHAENEKILAVSA
jgi:hypothetical protein